MQMRKSKFDVELERMTRLVYVVWAISLIVALSILGAIGYTAYKILLFFGIF